MEAAIEVWGVPALAPKQKLAFERHCTGDCGKISMSGLIGDDMTGGLFVCCQPTCPHRRTRTMNTPENSERGQPLAVPLNDQLGPLPAAAIELDEWGNGPYFDAGQMRAYAVREVAAERERCAKLCEAQLDEPASREWNLAVKCCAAVLRA